MALLLRKWFLKHATAKGCKQAFSQRYLLINRENIPEILELRARGKNVFPYVGIGSGVCKVFQLMEAPVGLSICIWQWGTKVSD